MAISRGASALDRRQHGSPNAATALPDFLHLNASKLREWVPWLTLNPSANSPKFQRTASGIKTDPSTLLLLQGHNRHCGCAALTAEAQIMMDGARKLSQAIGGYTRQNTAF